MTATISSNSQVVSEWVKIFPKQATENFTSSVTFMKQLTVVAVSTITYLKNIFPEDSYIVESFGGIKLRILKKKCRNELAQFVSTALTQAFEAFDKRYLHQLALCFYEDECKVENLIEYHIFDYTYHDSTVTMNVHSKNRDNVKTNAKYTFENVRERSLHMIRSCVVLMQSCQNELPSTYDVSLRLYYNEEAPPEYQAPGYVSAGEAQDHLGDSLAQAVRLGWVETAYHKLVARSYIKDTATASHEAIASQNPPAITQVDVAQSDPDDTSDVDIGDALLHCPCNLRRAERDQPLLTCHYCGRRAHAACYGVRAAQAPLVSRHCCAACHERERARPPTDHALTPLSDRRRECLCIFRRTLEWCTQLSVVDAKALVDKFGISDLNAAKLIKLLNSHKILDSDDANGLNMPQKIREDQLKSVISKFFHTTGEESIVDRLLAETFASQESHSDPISDVLSPLEKVSLQNASSVCQVVAPADEVKADAAMEDPTLKQYREAILSNDRCEELADVTEHLGRGVQRKSVKRKVDDSKNGGTRKLSLRSGVKTKRARNLPE